MIGPRRKRGRPPHLFGGRTLKEIAEEANVPQRLARDRLGRGVPVEHVGAPTREAARSVSTAIDDPGLVASFVASRAWVAIDAAILSERIVAVDRPTQKEIGKRFGVTQGAVSWRESRLRHMIAQYKAAQVPS